MSRKFYPILLGTCLLFATCSPGEPPLLEQVPPDQTGVAFVNEIIEDDTFNIVLYEYIYNGGGVGVGDFNRDGRPDLVFSGNRVSSALYLQTGDFVFTDVTAEAGLTTDVWCAGVSISDVDQNGWEDIYLATLHPDGLSTVPNLLFLNQGLNEAGIPQFREAAAEVGLDDRSYCTQAAWLDYDLDGDLDMYLLNNAIEGFNRNLPKGADHSGRGRSTDRFYRNDGTGANGLPQFTEIGDSLGIRSEGWGLGVLVQDLNADGYPDVYAANDFMSNDLIWINRGGQRFENRAADYLAHQSHNSMGVDIADINNDALTDIMVLDMLPDDNRRWKSMFSMVRHDRDALNRQRGYQQQYVRNVLQINHGNAYYSDIAYLAGVAATDWSWAPLMVDLDNDGRRDLYITNGYPKDITDLDFVSYSKGATQFGSDEARLKNVVAALAEVDGVHQTNFCYRNRGDLTFEDVSHRWTDGAPSYSNGAAYVDLDRDGDLDLVVNNINEPAMIYRNHSRQRRPEDSRYLQLRLLGPQGNLEGIGAKLWLYLPDGQVQYHEHYRQRGYLSTVESSLHFGLGSFLEVDSVRIRWPDGKEQVLEAVNADQLVELAYIAATDRPARPETVAPLLAGRPLPGSAMASESGFNDFNYQVLLQRKYSEEGPVLAVGDLNGDGLEDLLVGGAAGQSPRLYFQRTDGSLTVAADSLMFLPSAAMETTALAVVDYNGDGLPDIYMGHGSTEFIGQEARLQDQLYRNTGGGRFVLDEAALPPAEIITGAVAAADIDQDGDEDLFIGGRIEAGRYPEAPRSLLLRNEGGRYVGATVEWAPELARIGMVTAAAWVDLTGDDRPDLLLAGEYLPVSLWVNEAGRRLTRSAEALPAAAGWWRSLMVADWDQDGDLDIFAGNVGLNGPWRATADRPVCIRAADYDRNGSIDPVVTAFMGNTAYPIHPRGDLTQQLPAWKDRIPDYTSYGSWTAEDLPPLPADGMELCAYESRSLLLRNQGAGRFSAEALPMWAQTAPTNAFLLSDVNEDGRPDLLGIGNDYGAEVLGGRYDAGIGYCLLQTEDGGWQYLPPTESGWFVPGPAQDAVPLKGKAGTIWVVGMQNGPLQIYRKVKSAPDF